MRGCVSVLVLAAAFVLAAAWFGGPALAGSLVSAGLTAGGFEGRATSVTVTSDPPIEVLTGRADQVVIGSDDVTFDELQATRVDLVLEDVDLLGWRFGEVDGTLDGVRVRRAEGTIRVGRVELHGPSSTTDAVITMAGADVEAMAAAAINDALGLPIAGATLRAPDILRVEIAGQGVEARFVVEPGGALSLALPLAGQPRVEVVDPAPLDFASVTVLNGDLVLTGTLDLASLLGG